MKGSIFLFCFLMSIAQAQSKASSDPCAPAFTSGQKNWCSCFQRNLIKSCLVTSGDHIVCTDIHLREILQNKINLSMQHYQKYHPKEIKRMPFYPLAEYFAHCPITESPNENSKKFTIQDMNVDKKTKLNRHVIMIGLDGVRQDTFIKVYQTLKKLKQDTDFLDLVEKAGINMQFFAGGVLGTKCQQKTVSGAGWVTTLTGQWSYQHSIVEDDDIQLGKYNHHVPTIYNLIRDAYPDAIVASFSDWRAIATFATYHFHGNDNANMNYYYNAADFSALPNVGRQITLDIERTLHLEVVPTFIYAHYDYSDDSGHFSGFSSTSSLYVNAIRQEIDEIDLILKTIIRTQKEPWLIIITTDHGGHDHEHGTQQLADRNIFAVIGSYQNHVFKKYPVADGEQGQIYFVALIKKYLSSAPRSVYSTN